MEGLVAPSDAYSVKIRDGHIHFLVNVDKATSVGASCKPFVYVNNSKLKENAPKQIFKKRNDNKKILYEMICEYVPKDMCYINNNELCELCSP